MISQNSYSVPFGAKTIPPKFLKLIEKNSKVARQIAHSMKFYEQMEPVMKRMEPVLRTAQQFSYITHAFSSTNFAQYSYAENFIKAASDVIKLAEKSQDLEILKAVTVKTGLSKSLTGF